MTLLYNEGFRPLLWQKSFSKQFTGNPLALGTVIIDVGKAIVRCTSTYPLRSPPKKYCRLLRREYGIIQTKQTSVNNLHKHHPPPLEKPPAACKSLKLLLYCNSQNFIFKSSLEGVCVSSDLPPDDGGPNVVESDSSKTHQTEKSSVTLF